MASNSAAAIVLIARSGLTLLARGTHPPLSLYWSLKRSLKCCDTFGVQSCDGEGEKGVQRNWEQVTETESTKRSNIGKFEKAVK